ncbi:recombinase family protein [Leptolyngbya iicbica LK]|uniref:Recombinase family protein n=3 Tax=Cyanophyceae TaxID=3028117 RepID=A0A4Q7EIV5_9CYAN|nr:recombinase family protein [Leptolyngbya sp. LK]
MTTFAYTCLSPYHPVSSQPPFEVTVDRVYIDYCQVHDPRPELQRLLDDCRQERPERVLIQQLGDLGSSPAAVFARLKTLEEQGIWVAAADGSYATADTPSAELSSERLLQLAATVEAQHRRQQLAAGHARNRINLLPPPGRAPYGYRRGRYRYALDKATAPAVKAFFEQFILYGSIRGATRFLEKKYGKKISPSTAQRWLQHPIYRGDSEYKDGQVIRDTHTPIISRDEAAQVDRLLRRNRKLPPKTVSAERSLAGLVQCAECQSKLRVSRVTRPRQSSDYLYLRPMQCGREKHCRAIAYDAVLAQTIAAIGQEFPQAVANFQAPPVGAIKAGISAQITAKTDLLTQVDQLQAQGVLDSTSADLRRYTLRGELADLEQQRSQLPPENLAEIAQTLGSAEFWQGLSESERRVYLREFIQTIWLERDEAAWQVRIQFVF